MNKLLISIAFIAVAFIGCAAPNQNASRWAAMIETCESDAFTNLQVSTDSLYGFSPNAPVRVGGGAKSEYFYLSLLSGANGEVIDSVYRIGSYGGTNRSGASVMIDGFNAYSKGAKISKTIYLDMYQCDSIKIPQGFLPRKQSE